MKIEVDTAKCTGHARCAAAAADIYELDDDGFSAVTSLEVPAGREEDAERGANACPERAITVTAT